MKTIYSIILTVILSIGFLTAQTAGTTGVDGSGNTYPWVKIGNQYWTAENLRTAKFLNGEDIATGFENADWKDLYDKETMTGQAAYCIYPGAIQEDGYLYNWMAAVDERGICPEGWLVPTDNDFKILEMFLGMTQEKVDGEAWRHTDREARYLKSPDRSFGETAGSYGFNAVPAGHREKEKGNFEKYGEDAYFMTVTTHDPEDTNFKHQASRRLLRNSYKSIHRSGILKSAGMSIRCVSDDPTASGIANTHATKTIKNVIIYSITGAKVESNLENLKDGIYIQKINYTDGSIQNTKILIRK